VRTRYKRRLIQLNLNKSGLHELEWMTRDPYSLVNDSLITRTHCTDPQCGGLPEDLLVPGKYRDRGDGW